MVLLRAAILAGLALAVAWVGSPSRVASATQELAVVVHPSIGGKSLSGVELRHIFTGRRSVWSNGRAIVRLQYAPRDQLRREFDQAVLGMGPDRVAKFWIDQLVRGQARPPRVVSSAKLLARVVAKLPGAIGYLPRSRVTSGHRVVAVVRGGRVEAP